MTYPEEICTLLQNIGNAQSFVGQMPASPDTVIVVRATIGLSAQETHDGSLYEQLRFQVLVRAPRYADAWAIGKAAWRALFKKNLYIEGTWYQRIKPVDSLFDQGADSQQPPRRTVSFNCEAIRKEN
jgi:hypothetical protein